MAFSCFSIPFFPIKSSPSPRLHYVIKSAKPARRYSRSLATGLRSAAPVGGFCWDDVIRVAQADDDDLSDLRGYLQRVRTCNRGSELQTQFIPFVLEGEVVGHIHKGFISHLQNFQDVFTFSLGEKMCAAGGHVTIHSSLKTSNDRTRAIGDVINCLGNIIPGTRNELYPVVSSFGKPIFFSLERAAAPYFGIKAYGVHMNGYVVRDGKKFLWVGMRSNSKPTYPGMLDHLVAGGLPHGITCKENLVKECDEEAGIPRYIAEKAVSVGAVSYIDIEGHRFKRDVLFCYDLELPIDFVPKNEDGEVDSFRMIPVPLVANIIRRTEFFKPNCSLVIIDFLFRHGYVKLVLFY
ncbi:Nudix hydrolase 20, chloroplastic [Apostasia shenzhenica]|uniref:Nudix hydrolase 20, chloroplastic n=1 Tax=Apostasia shenzhenica TaxID=1088818 RepID=A0A2I0B8T2_9ASPA|nr:Nudix hydrolase 20, chloroplastic [Apostasia shenzhenica]